MTVNELLSKLETIASRTCYMEIELHVPLVDAFNNAFFTKWRGEWEEVPQDILNMEVYNHMVSPQYRILHIYLSKGGV